MIVYIKEHPFGAGKWIYRGYEAAWRALGYETRFYSNLLDIKEQDCHIMAIDYDLRAPEQVNVLKNAIRSYLFVQPHTFPSPWGRHPNFISQVPRELIPTINDSENIYKWSFADVERTNFYDEWHSVHYVPLAYDSENYRPPIEEEYSFDVCYVGGWANNGFDEKRKIIVNYLSAFKESGLRCGFAVNRGISHEQENKILSSSKVALNIHDAYQHSIGMDTNERTFKSLGLCGILVSDSVKCLADLFPSVQQATSPEEMLTLVTHLCSLSDKLLMEQKLKNRKNILENHTYIERVKRMLSLQNGS